MEPNLGEFQASPHPNAEYHQLPEGFFRRIRRRLFPEILLLLFLALVLSFIIPIRTAPGYATWFVSAECNAWGFAPANKLPANATQVEYGNAWVNVWGQPLWSTNYSRMGEC